MPPTLGDDARSLGQGGLQFPAISEVERLAGLKALAADARIVKMCVTPELNEESSAG